ncbi:hypothetical protein CRENBAI_010472 [Crenichthys baileyi]|uniref:Uncharacterized protein n=1 Tax=Crenichthys baileyi TaxID=28760 RepID=A0AAV9SQQ3_9TELE
MDLADEHQASSMDLFTFLSWEAEKTLRRSAGLSVSQSASDGSRLAIPCLGTGPLRRRSLPVPLAAHSGPAVKPSPSSRRKKRRRGAPSCSAGEEVVSLPADVRAAGSKPTSSSATALSPRLTAASNNLQGSCLGPIRTPDSSLRRGSGNAADLQKPHFMGFSGLAASILIACSFGAGLHLFVAGLHAFAANHLNSVPARDDLLVARLNSVPARDDLLVARLNSVPAWDDLLVARLNSVPAGDDLLVARLNSVFVSGPPAVAPSAHPLWVVFCF